MAVLAGGWVLVGTNWKRKARTDRPAPPPSGSAGLGLVPLGTSPLGA